MLYNESMATKNMGHGTWDMGRGAFTLLEVLIYTGLFALVGALLTGVASLALKMQGQSSASTEVSNQMNFVMQQVQRLVRDSSAIVVNNDIADSETDSALGAAGTYLHLRMHDSAGGANDRDPMVVWLDPATKVIKLQQGTGGSVTTSDLTSSKVAGSASALGFTKFSNPPGHDVVQIDLSLAYNTQNPASAVTRVIQGAIARVNAATFDSDLIPNTTNVRSVGGSGNRWVNGYFSGNLIVNGGANAKIGVGTDTPVPSTLLEVGSAGYLQFDISAAGPPPANDCNADSERGRVSIDTTNNRLYICNGATRLWDYVTLTN